MTLEETKKGLLAYAQQSPHAEVQKALAYGISFLGCTESPVGSNDGPAIHDLVKHYCQYWWIVRPTTDLKAARQRGYLLESEVLPPPSWCAMFVSNCIREGYGLPYWDWQSQGAKPLPGHPFKTFLGGATDIEKWAQKCGRLSVPSGPIEPGSIFTMDRSGSGSDRTTAPNASHTGLIIKDLGNSVITLEGNCGEAVKSITRPKSTLRYVIRWW